MKLLILFYCLLLVSCGSKQTDNRLETEQSNLVLTQSEVKIYKSINEINFLMQEIDYGDYSRFNHIDGYSEGYLCLSIKRIFNGPHSTYQKMGGAGLYGAEYEKVIYNSNHKNFVIANCRIRILTNKIANIRWKYKLFITPESFSDTKGVLQGYNYKKNSWVDLEMYPGAGGDYAHFETALTQEKEKWHSIENKFESLFMEIKGYELLVDSLI